jgi:signal transduction histidine kinase
MDRIPKVLVLLYVLLGYVVVQFVWWGYSIYSLNAALITDTRTDELVNPEQADELSGKVWMILGEGSVFLGLLLIGAFYIRRMILREHKLAKQERNFLLATTHEFNSPIAAVKLNLQTLNKRSMEGEQKQKVIDGALSSVQRLELLVTNLLMASRLDAGKLELLKEEVSLHGRIGILLERYRTLSENAGCKLLSEVPEGLTLNVDLNAFDTIFGNLIENAIKYGPESTILIKASENEGRLIIHVTDGGKGVPDDEKESIFKKFYRSENEETRTQKGSGLGLYLVKELVHLHRGEIRVEDATPRGASFVVELKTE